MYTPFLKRLFTPKTKNQKLLHNLSDSGFAIYT